MYYTLGNIFFFSFVARRILVPQPGIKSAGAMGVEECPFSSLVFILACWEIKYKSNYRRQNITFIADDVKCGASA